MGELSPDELLTTTRAVRRRLDLDRPVDDVRQGPLIPTAHTLGAGFRPARRAPLESVVHRDRWSSDR